MFTCASFLVLLSLFLFPFFCLQSTYPIPLMYNFFNHKFLGKEV
nr:MAG TPA: hypothetical protein [Caudoviricetes sp.]